MKRRYMSIALVASIALASGCTIFDPHMGQSVNSNTQAQVLDPYAGFTEGVSTLDGQKAEKLLKEYRVEKAKAPTERLLKDIGD